MRRLMFWTAAGLLSALVLTGSLAASGQKKQPPKDSEVCTGDFGTSVQFMKTPLDAAKQAKQDQKLVFVLHVSGDFEDPDFT
jgi:hypothetical protein